MASHELDEPVECTHAVSLLLRGAGVQPDANGMVPRWTEAIGRVLLAAVWFQGSADETRRLVEAVREDRELQRMVVGSLRVGLRPLEVFFAIQDWRP